MWRISASLLNSWNYIFKENDVNKAYSDFVSYLNREHREPTEAMQRGIDFEKSCIDGLVPGISDVIVDGSHQLYAEKIIKIDDMTIKLVGYIDTLKEGIIYDIKRTSQYEFRKYYDSFQHHVYFELIPSALKFIYLIGAGYKNYDIIIEEYDRKEKIDLVPEIRNFFNWLKRENLFDTYIKNFKE